MSAKKTTLKPVKPNAVPRESIPTDPVTIVSLRYEPSALAHGMDVDRLHNILRSAEAGDTRDLFSLYRDIVLSDSHLQGEFAKRKLAVLGDKMTFQPADRANPADVEAAASIQAMVSGCKAWRIACAQMLDSCLYPVSLVEKVYSAEILPGRTGKSGIFRLKTLVPVPHHLLDFSQGSMRIYDVAADGSMLSSSHIPEPFRYIIHRGHILSAPDNWGGPMRSILFWWLLSAMDREWWARFLDRYGSPFMVGTYDRGDKDSRSVLERAFALSVKLGGLVVAEGTRVEIKEAASANTGDAYEKFLGICQREKSKLILGQTLSAEASPTGELGGGTARMQESVRQDIRKFDAVLLSETLRDQLFTQFLQINNLQGQPPVLSWGSDSVDEIKATMSFLASASDAGFELDDSGLATLSERSGLSLRRRTGTLPPRSFSARDVLLPHPFSATSFVPPPRRA